MRSAEAPAEHGVSEHAFPEHAFTVPALEPPQVVDEKPVDPAVMGSGWHFSRTFDVTTFRRGNLHTHSNRSDGDSDPADVYTWYREHGYDFVVLTDHNTFTDPARYKAAGDHPFVAIGGEEVTMLGARRQVHVNAICTHSRLPGGRFASAQRALTFGVGEIREVGGVALVNHPNFTWGIASSDLPSALGAQLLEIQSGHPAVRTMGNLSHPSHEALWDMALTAGLDFMGVAVDDAHYLRTPGRARQSHPGRGWVEVFADSPDEETICRALGEGRLYASTGAKLARISVTEDTYSIWPAEAGAEVQFVGVEGRLLASKKLEAGGEFASYTIAGSERYVRARVIDAHGERRGLRRCASSVARSDQLPQIERMRHRHLVDASLGKRREQVAQIRRVGRVPEPRSDLEDLLQGSQGRAVRVLDLV